MAVSLPVTDYRDPVNIEEIEANGWMLWPPIRYSYTTTNVDVPRPCTFPADLDAGKPTKPAENMIRGPSDPLCNYGNWNWFGTDDQARDVSARLIYGFRISVLFGPDTDVVFSGCRHQCWRCPGLLRRLGGFAVSALH